MTRIVTTRYRYKRPTLKQEAVALEVPDVVRPKRKKAAPLTVEAIPSHPAIVGKAKPATTTALILHLTTTMSRSLRSSPCDGEESGSLTCPT